MNNIIIVQQVRKANIVQLHQYESYINVGVGYANARTNSYLLRDAIECGKKICGINEIYVIHPGEDIVNPKVGSNHPPYVELPSITCIAELRCDTTIRNQTGIYTLGVCWFQDEYAFPIDESILEKFKEIPFSTLCVEYIF
jgi:hypothetical protein